MRAGALGRALQLGNEAETPIRLDEGTALIFPAPEPEKSFLLKLIEGVVYVLPQALTFETAMVTAGVEGRPIMSSAAPADTTRAVGR